MVNLLELVELIIGYVFGIYLPGTELGWSTVWKMNPSASYCTIQLGLSLALDHSTECDKRVTNICLFIYIGHRYYIQIVATCQHLVTGSPQLPHGTCHPLWNLSSWNRVTPVSIIQVWKKYSYLHE